MTSIILNLGGPHHIAAPARNQPGANKGADKMVAEEKRLYPRLALNIEDGYFGNFRLENNENIVAPIVNLSAGGINMAVPETSRDKVKEGDILLLKTIVGGTSISFLSDIKGEVRWIKNLDLPKYFSVGCRFQNLDEDVRAQLSRFVDSERMARGQYD